MSFSYEFDPALGVVEVVRFYETAARNRGWRVEVFTERAAAVEFLTR